MSESHCICSVPNCGRKFSAKGFCKSHYERARLGLTTEKVLHHRRPDNTPPRIICRETKCSMPGLEGPCHEFVHAKLNGYGIVQYQGKCTLVHRYVWERDIGPIPEGLVIDHRCRNRACCNTNHLRLVTLSVNSKENVVGASWQLNSDKTHCPHGHPFDETNTYRSKTQRQCRECNRQRMRRRRQSRS